MAAVGLWTEREARALRALHRSGRRLVRCAQGWAVLEGGDRRRRAVIELSAEEGARLVSGGGLRPAAAGPGYVPQMEARTEALTFTGPAVFDAAGVGRRRAGGSGFLGLARRAEAGEGPLSLRAVRAGLRIIEDAEASHRRPGLTMNWDAIPADRGRRAAGDGGLMRSARAAAERLDRIARQIGRNRYQLAWRACVEGETLSRLAQQGGVSRSRTADLVCEALEAAADAYDAGG